MLSYILLYLTSSTALSTGGSNNPTEKIIELTKRLKDPPNHFSTVLHIGPFELFSIIKEANCDGFF